MDIKMLILDVDGTLTDGKLYIGAEGERFKVFHVKDGYGIRNILPMIKHADGTQGVIPVVLTSRESQIVRKRCLELGIHKIYQGINDKERALDEILDRENISYKNTAYMGDDLNDLPCMAKCGFSACPADAAKEVRGKADFISVKNGGEGAVRDFIDLIAQTNCLK